MSLSLEKLHETKSWVGSEAIVGGEEEEEMSRKKIYCNSNRSGLERVEDENAD